MPVAVEEELSGIDAYDQLVENLGELQTSASANDEDVQFLRDFLNNPALASLMEAHDVFQDTKEYEPVGCDTVELVKDIVQELDTANPDADALRKLLTNPYIKSLVEAHDDIASKNYEPDIDPFPVFSPPPEIFDQPPSTDAIRMVGIRKNGDEPLGILVEEEQSQNGLRISRIMAGSMIERQGLLHVGDIIKEINGQEVSSPEQMTEVMKKAGQTLTLKILPTFFDNSVQSQIYLRAHFTYDPRHDKLIPCREAGLYFREGDILQVVNREDNNWWQARKVDSTSATGLIPSQTLEEKRKAFVRPEFDYTQKSLLCGLMTKKKKKMMYNSTSNPVYDRSDLMIYEEVARMPPFQRKTLVLVGAQGVGRRTLKQRLCKADPHRFGYVLPCTSRMMRRGETDGEKYWFCNRDEMEFEIAHGKYLEHGEYDGNYYGVKYEHIRQVIRQGKMCILDLNPLALKQIKTSEFMPYVVFLAAPPVEIMRNMHENARIHGKIEHVKTEREFRKTLEESANIEKQYKHFFDMGMVNDNMNETYNRLRKIIETLSTEPQWVPVSWVY